MKYAVIIASGAPDAPIADLDGQTPLQIATTPALDRVAKAGRVGTATLTPGGLAPTTDVAIAALLGVEAASAGAGPGGVLATGAEVQLGPQDWGIVADLVSVGDEGMVEASGADVASPAEAAAMFEAVEATWRRDFADDWNGCSLLPTVGGRAVMIDQSSADFGDVQTSPPWEALGEPWEGFAPVAPGGRRSEAARLTRLIEASYDALRDHEVNRARAEVGHPPLNAVWLWGPGIAPAMADITTRTGLGVGMLSEDPIVRGIAKGVGAQIGASAFADDAALGQAACEAIDRFDLVFVHYARAARASFAGDAQGKADALRSLDAGVIAPIVKKLASFGDAEAQPDRPGWRLLVASDRYVITEERRPDPTPVPFAMAGAWVRSVVARAMTEADANTSDLHVDPGHDLLEYFLRGGLARVRPVRG
ncbi:MAG: hypothetical protein AAGI53_11215 [Planctomycetota bacterium]